ncbi:MAG TPA: hypothetical protein VGK58_08780 [Lacipirellulaceae bacterium]
MAAIHARCTATSVGAVGLRMRSRYRMCRSGPRVKSIVPLLTARVIAPDVGPLREEMPFPASSCRNDEPALPIDSLVFHWIATCDGLAVGMAVNECRRL